MFRNKHHIKWGLLICIQLFLNPIIGQDSLIYIIDAIELNGNTYTKDRVIHRVMDISVGDTLSINGLEERLYENEKRIYDTKLFNKVETSYFTTEKDHITLVIDLQKAWFIFPAPIFEIGAENFNAWSKTYDYSLDWIDYGLRLTHINLTGNNDDLKLTFQSGFTKKYELNYNRPFLPKSNLGYSFNAYYTTNKSAGYATENNKLIYHEDKENIVLKRFRLDGTIYHRPDPIILQLVKMQYHNNTITDTIAKSNKDYFLDFKTSLKYFQIEYHIKYDARVFKLYPESGFMAFLTLKKEGIGVYNSINTLILEMAYDQYHDIGNNMFFQYGLRIKKQLLNHKIPYSNYSSLGYGDSFVRGYEPYIIDGADFLMLRTSFRKNIYNQDYNLGKWMPLKPYKKLFTKWYLRFNIETGYVNDPFYADTNTYNNNILLGFGPAIDLILYNNHLFSLEYNANILGQHSIYLHNNITF